MQHLINMRFKYISDVKHIENIIDLFLEFVAHQPEQDNLNISFGNGYLQKTEGYKLNVYAKASVILETHKWNEGNIISGEIAQKAIKVMNISDNNFVFKNQKMDFVKRLQEKPVEGGKIIFNLFQTDNDEESMEALAEFFGRKYDVLSYLFYLKNPNLYSPCKPTKLKESFNYLKMETYFFQSCTYQNFYDYCEALRELAMIYSNYVGHINVLDAHSFAWVIAHHQKAREYIFEDPQLYSNDKKTLPDKEKQERFSKVKVRLNQSEFRKKIIEYWGKECCVTSCKLIDVLIASHIKPWRDCKTNNESTNVYNGLLLSPNLDKMFDAGFISFENSGDILISSKLSEEDMDSLGIKRDMKLKKVEEFHFAFLDYHRKNIFIN